MGQPPAGAAASCTLPRGVRMASYAFRRLSKASECVNIDLRSGGSALKKIGVRGEKVIRTGSRLRVAEIVFPERYYGRIAMCV